MSKNDDQLGMSRTERLNGDRLLTIEQAASRMGVSVRMVRRLTSERRLAFVKIGKHVRIATGTVDAFVAAGYVPALNSPKSRLRSDQAYGIGSDAEVVLP